MIYLEIAILITFIMFVMSAIQKKEAKIKFQQNLELENRKKDN